MVHDASPQVSVREVGADAARPLLARVDAFMTNDRETVASMTAVGRCFVISQDDRDVAAYVLQRQGRECFVLAAAGAVDFDLTAFGLALIEAHARGLDSVAFQTRRAGLIRKASRLGYRIAGRVANGVVMRKELK
ncbi:hypothetical protein BamMEX5DRAFT_2257 [Burkholderia ambifaria MEX-5]|uniref:GCN5-related N-acetyltransferase n=2 Tax=Burkholderia ambifaria TaxID=152480 RepID=B1T391_9BURK|nr:hypothetical protein BamMEX5DRAFT_2257 [Burkholderia ambifaria MEX-5]